MPYIFEEPEIEEKPRYVFEEPEVEPKPEPEKPRYVFEEPEEPEYTPEEKTDVLENISPLAQPYIAQTMAFATEAGRKGVTRSVKKQLSGATFGLSELIPGMKTEKPITDIDKALAISNEIMGSLLPWGAFEKYVIGPLGMAVGTKVAALAAHRKILKGLGSQLATKFAIRGLAAPAIDSLKTFIKTRDVPSLDQLVKEGLIVGGIGGIFDMLGDVAYPVMKSLSNIAKSEKRPLWDVYKEFGRAIKNRGFSFIKGKVKPITPEKVLEIGQDFAVKKGFPIEPIKPIEKPPIVKPIEPIKVPEIEEPVTLKIPPPTTKSPETLEPEKPPPDDPASSENITDATSKYFSKLSAKFSVEAPFIKAGAPETGFSVKNYYDQVNMHIEQGKFVVKQIKKLKLTEEQLHNVMLQAQYKEPPKDMQERKAWLMVRSYYDKALKNLKKFGVIKKGFHERVASDLLAQIKSLHDLAKISKGKEKIRLLKEAQDLTTQLKEVAKLRFVSIPVRELFDAKVKNNPTLGRRAIKYLNRLKRKTLKLEDLIESGLITKEDITPSKFINDYAAKYGRDIALAKIIKNGLEEGMISQKFVEGMVKIPGYMAPELAKYWVSPALADFLQGFTNPKKFSGWEKLTSRTKGWALYNPFVLGFNNMWQHIWAVLGQPKHLLKVPGAWKQAILDVKNKTANYWEALDNGIRSSPFVALEKTLQQLTTSVAKQGPNPLCSMLKTVGGLVKNVHEAGYDAMQSIAWTGGDLVPRMATYNWLRSLGLSPRDAAQTAALFHGDYASIPPDLRRKLNKIFFTPTFQLVMISAVTENLKNTKKVAEIIYKKAKGEKGEKIDPKTKARAAGTLGMATILGSFHMTMTALGWETVFPLWHYKKDYIDEEGNKKTRHFHISMPFITSWKYVGRIYTAFTEPGVENRVMKFLKSMKFIFAIPIQIGWEIAENKTRHWKEVYDPRAPLHEQLYHAITYVAKRVFPALGKIMGEGFRSAEDIKEIRREFGLLLSFIPSIFPYITDPKEEVNLRKAKYLQNKMKKLMRQEKLTEKQQENYMKEIDRLLKED